MLQWDSGICYEVNMPPASAAGRRLLRADALRCLTRRLFSLYGRAMRLEMEPDMPTVQDILAAKGNKVFSVPPTATVLEATQKMNRNKIGAIMVMDGPRMVGIFTERDVLQRVIGAMQRPEDMRVADAMTSSVICCRPDDDINEVG